jgi:hypothetical protein
VIGDSSMRHRPLGQLPCAGIGEVLGSERG